MKRLALLFWEFSKISLFVIGGGYAIIAVADQTLSRRGWTEEGELLDRLPVFQMVPGLIATHTAVYVGRKVGGFLGAIVAVAAVAWPSVLIFTFVSAGYDSIPVDAPLCRSAFLGLRSALTGIIAATIIRGWTRNLNDVFSYSLAAVALAALFLGEEVWIVLACAMAAGLLETFSRRSVDGSKQFRSSLLPLLLFLKYGALCFGGGFVLVPMYIEDFVGPSAAFLQVTEEEFSNLMALTQMTPGPIGVNGATYFGFRLAGIPGAVLASAALLLPGSALAYFAFASLDRFRSSAVVRGVLRGVRPASVALMLVALAAFAKMSVFDFSNQFSTFACILVIISAIMTVKKKMNPVLLIILCAVAASAVRAEDAITTERYPDADSVLVDSVTRVSYKPDGNYYMEDENWVKILTEKGRREESSLSMRYSKRYATAGVLYVGAIAADGTERQIDVSATTSEATDNSSMSENIYDPMDRNIVCSIPGLKVGETVHTKIFRKTFKARCENKWSEVSVMEWTQPIVRSSWEIVAPAERPLRRIVIRNPLDNIASSKRLLDDGSTLHVFTCTNSPQAFSEPDMPPLWTQVQSVRVSTAEDWPEISKWYWDLCLPHISKTTPEMTNKVYEVVKGVSGREARVRAVFKFVSQEIRYMGLTMEDTSPGYAPHDIDITFNNRYGVCRDKAGLLVAMLRIAGFEAFPVLINVGAKLDPEVPQPYFNHAIVAVQREDGGYDLMDPTNENAKDLFPAYESDKSYLVCRPEGDILRTSPVPTPETNSLKVDSQGVLSKDGSLYLENDIAFNGINDTAYRNVLVTRKPEDRVKTFERVVKSLVPGAELVKCDIEPKDMRDTESPMRVHLVSRLPEVVLRGVSQDSLTVPYISSRLGMANFLLGGNTSLAKRRFPLDIDSTASIDEKIVITVEDGALGEAKDVPADEKIGSGCEYTRVFTVADGVIDSRRRVSVNKVEFSPEEYVTLREDLKKMEAAGRKNLVFTRDAFSNADIRWFLDSYEVDVTSDRAWTLTNRIEKEILTYEGKKRSAEFKVTYNPTVESVEIVSAVVSNRDGTVSSVSPKEINTMDCGWAAAAPRYPASRIIVVNLPSVEIGSVISYTIVHTVTNAPAPFYGVFGFDFHEPVDRRFVRVNDWSREVVSPVRVPNEPGQPMASLWRDQVIISSNRFERMDFNVEPYCGSDSEPLPFEDLTPKGVRDWMARHVKIAGPGLYEVPLDLQLADPGTVLRERYATRLDYVRTMCALLKGAGWDADVVLAANDANDPEVVKNRIKFEKPNVRAFSNALCRVRIREGGFLCFGGRVRETFIGLENEYTPLGATSYEGCDYFDPETCEFGVVTVTDPDLSSSTAENTEIDVRENGAVDMVVETVTRGVGVGTFRKRYNEILPEDRSRLYQSILGGIAQAATATSELEADTEGYPAKRRFSCFVPDYATVEGDAITLRIPAMISTIPTFTGKVRSTPFYVGAERHDSETVTVRFPEGYTEVEHMPEPFVFSDPRDGNSVWLESAASSKVVDGRLEVTLLRTVYKRAYTWFAPDYIELLRDRNRIAGSRANRTIVARRKTSKAKEVK